MTPEQREFLYGPGHIEPTVVPVRQDACANVTVTTKDGRVFNLGSPDSIFFPIRRWFYMFRRRNELKGATHG